MEHYRDGIYAMKQRSDFEILVRERQVDYYFQPIFSARDGHVAAYEALMRPRLPALSSPQKVMELASEMGRLYDIEKLTLFRACECYEALEAAGKVEPDALVFVNSIASVSLNDEDWAHFRAAHKAILSKLVVEITEEEEMDEQALERKRNATGAPAVFALDDYGSGYSNGSSLLTIAPRYVKVDIAIIRGIDADPAACRCWPRAWRRWMTCAGCWRWAWTFCRATVWPARPQSLWPSTKRRSESSKKRPASGMHDTKNKSSAPQQAQRTCFFFAVYWIKLTKKGQSTAVRTPATAMDRPLIAPSTSPI